MQIDASVLSGSWRSWVSQDMARVGPYWLQLLWTLLFSMVMALGFTVLGFFFYASGGGAWRNLAGWAEWYGRNLIVALTIGSLIHGLYALCGRLLGGPARIRRFGRWQRLAYFTAMPLCGVLLGWPLGLLLAGADLAAWFSNSDLQNTVAGTVLLSLLLSALIFQWFSTKARQIDAERRAAEAQLRLLQAQIEPHFLFNTLANVAALIEHDAPKARQMLESFTDYLRSSLTALRHDHATLGTELDLVRAYLELLRTRMEGRLHFAIDADAALHAVRMPPLLLQPLVENAIHHGLEPKVEGGSVQVRVRAEGGTLVIDVLDDGLGLAAPQRRRRGAGMALANLRERLAAHHGTQASLTLADNHPGTRATVRLPLETAA